MNFTDKWPCSLHWFVLIVMNVSSANQDIYLFGVSSDETVSHVDYEDKFTDSYEEHHDNPRMEDAQGGLFEEESRDAYRGEKRGHQQQETSYGRLDHQDQQTKVEEDRDTDEERAVEDFVGHPSWEQEQESRQVERTDTGGHRTTEAPVSLLSQKHMFWFPSEAFQEEGRSVTETTQRASDGVSEESKDQESRESDQQQQSPHDAGDHHPEQETYDNLDTSDPVDHDDSRHGDQDDRDDVVTHYIPRQHDDLDLLDQHSKHDDDHYDHSEHYDMGEHEDDQVRHGTQGYDDGEDTYDHHESYEDHEDVTSDPEVTIQVHPEDSREHHDHDNHDNHGDVEEHYDSQEDHDNNSHSDHDGHDHDAHDSHDRHDSHEDDSHQQVFFSVATDEQQNLTKKEEGETTTDDTWLDGYPVVPAGAEKGESTTTSEKLDQRESGTRVRTTDRPNEVETGLVPGTSSPEEHQSPTQEYEKVVDVWPVWISTSTPHPGHLDSLDPSYSDTFDYDTQQPGPTPSWPEDLTEDPSLDQGPAPSLHENDILVSVMEDNNLPGEAGERGETEGELGETVCVGEDCPPHPPSSSMKGSTVTAVIVAVCLLAAAVMVGVWCYRRLQQKSSVYEMNGKGQSRTRQGQQIEMQQKV